MAEYHVGTSPISGTIYAGRMKELKDGWKEWIAKSEVTNEAINAVAVHMYLKIKDGENGFAYALKLNSGEYLRLKLEVSDHKPEWLDEEAEEEKNLGLYLNK